MTAYCDRARYRPATDAEIDAAVESLEARVRVRGAVRRYRQSVDDEYKRRLAVRDAKRAAVRDATRG